MATLIAQLLMLLTKSKEYHNLSQAIQCYLAPAGYLFPLIYAIYVAKADLENWSHDVNYVRVWLLIEISYFWCWLGSGICFILYAYIAKFKSIFKNEVLLSNDDNVWNDKDTDDFLRYLKKDYYMFAYMLAFMAMELRSGFFHNENYENLNQKRSLETTGLDNPVNLCFLLCFIVRASNLLFYIFFLGRKGKKQGDYAKEDGDKYEKSHDYTHMNKMEKFAFPLYCISLAGAIYYIWSKNNYL